VLHIGLSGLVGFGLVRSRAIRKPGRSILFILAAAGLHGAWNSLALYSGLTVLPVMGERGGDTSNPAAIISILLMALVFASVVIINFFIYRFIKQNIQIEVSTAQS
jgi:RsiW-degrading membrane proteinase PrsW (M82 family)